MAYEVKQCFDSVMISFNGFSESSYNTIMNVSDVEKTKSFCNELKKLNVNMCLKFLCSPIVIQEISYFLKWAIDIEPASVVLQEAFLYEHDEKYSCKRIGSVFNQLDNSYWKDIYKRVAVQISNILKETKIDNYSGFLCADEGLFRILPLPEEYRSLFDTSGIYNLK